jgi:APA family basic amino acid/polyamine antiporter
VIILRSTAPDLPRGFKVPLYPVVPILSVLGCIYIIVGLDWITIVVFVVWVAVVLVWYFTYGIRHSRLGART